MMKPSFIILCALIGLTTAHPTCWIAKTSLGLATSEVECSSKCQAVQTIFPQRKCLGWGYSYETEACDSWVVSIGSDDYHYFDGVGGANYNEYIASQTTCEANINSTADLSGKNVGETSGCFFMQIDLGVAETPDVCRELCEELDVSKYGDCIAWGNDPSESYYYYSYYNDDSSCSGVVVVGSNDYDYCGVLP